MSVRSLLSLRSTGRSHRSRPSELFNRKHCLYLSLFSSITLLSHLLGFCLFVCVCVQNASLEWNQSCIHGYLWSTISFSLIKHEWDNHSYIRSQFEGYWIKTLAFKLVVIKSAPHKRECILFLIHNFGSLLLSF